MSDLCIDKKRHERKNDIKELESKEQWHKMLRCIDPIYKDETIFAGAT